MVWMRSDATATETAKTRIARAAPLESALPTAHAATTSFWLGEALGPVIGAEVRPLRAGSTFRRFVDLESTALELGAVKLRDRLGDRRWVLELHERESAGLTCGAIDGEEDFVHLADVGKKCFDFRLGCAEG